MKQPQKTLAFSASSCVTRPISTPLDNSEITRKLRDDFITRNWLDLTQVANKQWEPKEEKTSPVTLSTTWI